MKSDVRRTANEAEKTPQPLSENGLSLKESGSTPALTGPNGGKCCHVPAGLEVVPVTQKRAKAYIAEYHRHHKPPVGDVIRVGVARLGELVGVAMAGRPVARMLDDGHTLEVTRCCTDGTPNACSMLYGACWRAAKALGWRRLITYTLPSEGGASLRAAGWTHDGEAGGGEWTRPSRGRKTGQHPTERKHRWVKSLPHPTEGGAG